MTPDPERGAGESRPESAPPMALRRLSAHTETVRANRAWWDAEADDYYAEHGEFLGDSDFVWGPEGLRESEAHLLGSLDELRGRRVLEVGSGAAQCSRWLAAHGVTVVATDLSAGMLRRSRAIDAERAEADAYRAGVPVLQADATALPFADGAFDVVFTSYGAVPFVADSAGLMLEASRVLRPGGRFVFSTTHPVRWALADDPGEMGLRVTQSYFDRRPYVEQDVSGQATYVEHHRTLGDRVRELTAAGLLLVDVVEPEWPETNAQTWGGWSPMRGELVPGTAIFVALKG